MRVIIEVKGRRQEFHLKEGVNIIGREAGCDVFYPDSSLSRRHLEAKVAGEELVVRDLGTKNGTFLGPQRVKEARIKPGVRLRAGNVWLRFETDAPSGPAAPAAPPPSAAATPAPPPAQAPGPAPVEGERRAAEAAATGREHPELARAVPDAPHLEANDDDEATPVDENIARAVAADAAGAMTSRDGHYFVKDAATGAEIEVVPGAMAGAPSRAAPGHRKLFLILAAAVAAILIIAACAGVAIRKSRKPPQYLSADQCRTLLSEALKGYDGPAARVRCAEALEKLLEQPLDSPSHRLTRSLLDALKTDEAARRYAPDWWDKAQKAENLWKDLQHAAGKDYPFVGALCQARLDGLEAELKNMVRLNEARTHMERGDSAEALQYASGIPAESVFYDEAIKLVPEAADVLVRKCVATAESRDWTKAIALADDVIKLKPDLKAQLVPKQEQWRRYETQRQHLEAAKQQDAAKKYSEVLQTLGDIGADSPYASEADPLRATARKALTTQAAVDAYNAKDGKKALELLAQAGDPDPELARKIQAVMALREEGYKQIKAGAFDAAKAAFSGILQRETAQNNQYAQEAKKNVEQMPQVIRATAHVLVEEADAAVLNREYAKARQKYSEARRLDPGSRESLDGLKNLEKGALKDYNWALNMTQTDPEKSLRLFLDVRDRLSPTDKLYADTLSEIATLRARLGKDVPVPK